MSTKYEVIVDSFAERYYLKGFRRKYKKSFEAPWGAFLFMLQKFDLMLERENTSVISDSAKNILVCKVKFKILPNESAKTSGNRCIVVVDKNKYQVRVLLVYSKNDIKGKQETLWWKNKIKRNFSNLENSL